MANYEINDLRIQVTLVWKNSVEFSIDFYKNMSMTCLEGMAYKKCAPDANNLNIVSIGEF
jgi:hypothetical protein